MTKTLYVIDTNGLISFFAEVFAYAPEFDSTPVISRSTRHIIQQAVYSSGTEKLLSVPSIVFVEIFEKWLRSTEFRARFYYDVFLLLQASENVEIRSIDQEVLENLLAIDGCLQEHDLHDKIVVASAMTLKCPIITSDPEIIKFVASATSPIPRALN